ncbi:unnamed protein product [Clonostachys rosea f. rosea IK726]|uniref:Uncharacterized protein n=1 Tax=Clonostachys rosea f. rosea IK726 TaxID=1349383 RepID=A0ACA9TBG9_BIOOC|nr:unnamed protein product [Clonostachys rosea f. rosea IK726]
MASHKKSESATATPDSEVFVFQFSCWCMQGIPLRLRPLPLLCFCFSSVLCHPSFQFQLWVKTKYGIRGLASDATVKLRNSPWRPTSFPDGGFVDSGIESVHIISRLQNVSMRLP